MIDKATLLQKLKADFLCPNAGKALKPGFVVGPAAVDFRTLEDYRRVQEMQSHFAENDASNPYFIARNGFNRDTIEAGNHSYINFSGYNYLDLSSDPRVINAVCEAARQYGTAAGASRIVGGEIALHAELERELAETFGFEDCVATVGGYVCNLTAIAYLCGANDLILHDDCMHNSAVMGAVLSGARRIAFPHNDLDRLEQLLAANRAQYERVIVMVEGAYSMDGDLPDLPRLIEIKRRHHAWLMVDEAHSLGVIGPTGRGIAEHYQVDPRDIDIVMGTLSKSFGSCGGFIAGSTELVTLLRIMAPGFLLYSTGLPPTSTAAALAAVRIMREEPERVHRLQRNISEFTTLARSRNLDIDRSGRTAVVPVVVGKDEVAMRIMTGLLGVGVLVHAVIHPVVPRNKSRLRFFLNACHRTEQFTYALDHLVRFLREEEVA
jgi:8-amino-7-oxononanoate synthase